MKISLFLLNICFLFWFSLCLGPVGQKLIKGVFEQRKSVFSPEWQILGEGFLDRYFEFPIFERVSNVKEIASLQPTRIMFQCDYETPQTKWMTKAMVTFIPEKDRENFDFNLFWAKITGSLEEDHLTPSRHGYYSIDKDEMDVQANLGGFKSRPVLYISQFDEMQLVHATLSKRTRKMTILVHAGGVQTLESPLFEGNWDRGLKQNTEEFLRLYLELCMGVMLINQERGLHGGLSPKIVNVEVDWNGERHLAIQGFDFHLNRSGAKTPFDPLLRYDGDYRSPNIDKKSADAGEQPNTGAGQAQPALYFYTQTMKEDTYALGAMFLELLKTNKTKLDPKDDRIPSISGFITKLRNFSDSLDHWPESKDWQKMISDIIQEEALILTKANIFFNILTLSTQKMKSKKNRILADREVSKPTSPQNNQATRVESQSNRQINTLI